MKLEDIKTERIKEKFKEYGPAIIDNWDMESLFSHLFAEIGKLHHIHWHRENDYINLHNMLTINRIDFIYNYFNLKKAFADVSNIIDMIIKMYEDIESCVKK